MVFILLFVCVCYALLASKMESIIHSTHIMYSSLPQETILRALWCAMCIPSHHHHHHCRRCWSSLSWMNEVDEKKNIKPKCRLLAHTQYTARIRLDSKNELMNCQNRPHSATFVPIKHKIWGRWWRQRQTTTMDDDDYFCCFIVFKWNFTHLHRSLSHILTAG